MKSYKTRQENATQNSHFKHYINGFRVVQRELSNVANVLAFRTGPDDARRLADWFGPEIDPLTLTRLPNHVLAARLLAAGTPRPPIRVRTEPPVSIAPGG